MAAKSTPTTFHVIAPGDRGTVPVTVLRDFGDVLQVMNVAAGIGGGTLRTTFWVARRDFVPVPRSRRDPESRKL